jgi:hypothetical protein
MPTIENTAIAPIVHVVRDTGNLHTEQADNWTEAALILQQRIYADYRAQRGQLSYTDACALIHSVDRHRPACTLQVGISGGIQYVIDQHPRQPEACLLHAIDELKRLGSTAEQLASQFTNHGQLRTSPGWSRTPMTRYLEWWSGRQWQIVPGLRLRLVGSDAIAALPAAAATFSSEHAAGAYPDLIPLATTELVGERISRSDRRARIRRRFRRSR